MGILSRIKNRLSIIAGDPPRPAASYNPPPPRAPAAPPAAAPVSLTQDEVRANIEADVKAHTVVIFMKGTRNAPQCGFSAAAVGIFEELGVPFETRNVLADSHTRQVIKDLTSWPTIPQIFVGGEFIGGTDILRELHQKGELKPMVEQAFEAAGSTPAT